MRRFFPFRSFTSTAGNGKAAQGNDKRNENKPDVGRSSGSSNSPDSEAFSPTDQHGELRVEESSNTQLRRCRSFTSSAIDRSLRERRINFSGHIPCSMSNSSDAPRLLGDAECYTWSPERHPDMGRYTAEVPKAYEIQDTGSPQSRCYSCSTGHSPVSSPIALKCRSARLTNLLDKNEVLDLYIDGEQEAHGLNVKHKQKYPIRSGAPNLGHGRPPRPHSTAPPSPKSCKEIAESYSNINTIDGFHNHLAQDGTEGIWEAACTCDADGDDTRLFQGSSDNPSHFKECKSGSMTTVEDIYVDMQDLHPPCFYDTSMYPISGATSRCFPADTYHHDESHSSFDINLEQDTDEELLRRAKEVVTRFTALPAEMNELTMLRDKRLKSSEMLQLIQSLIEERKKLSFELSSQIKARLAERFAAKEQYKRCKIELDTRTRRLEKEKTDVQITLERELDRRSNDWTVKQAKFQSEEQRLQDRVRELAEQNVSFQREVTLLELKGVDASSRIKSLELQNKQLNDELLKVKNEHDNLYSSSEQLHHNLTKAAEERDQIRDCLKEKDDGNKALYKVIARLQRICTEQEKTIAGLRQGFNVDLEKRSVGSSEGISRMQMELMRLSGVEQKLRKEIHSCTLEVEYLRQENIAILNRLQSSGKGLSFSSVRLDQELHTRVDTLQMQGLLLLDDISQLCVHLLDLIKSKKSENVSSVDALATIEYTLKLQSIKERTENLKRNLRTTKSVLIEKSKEEETGKNTEGGNLRQDRLSKDDIEIKLKEEAMLARVLKEKLLSRELDIEQLQSDLASSVRIQDVMQNEIQRVQDELCCLSHKSKHLELQVLKKDESINQIQQDCQESSKELTALRCTLKTVSDERDVLWQETKQLRKTVSDLQQKIKSLDEDIQLKEGEILLRDGEISILRDSIDKPFDIICSPQSMKQFDME